MDADGGDADFKRRRSREGHLSASFSPRQREGERGDHSLLAPGPGGGEVRLCWAVRQRQTMAQQHGPRRRAIGRVRGGRPFRNISHSRGKPAALPLCPWIVSKWQPPRWIPPMKTVSRASSSAGPCRRRPRPGCLVVQTQTGQREFADHCLLRDMLGGVQLGGGVQIGEEKAQDGRISLETCGLCWLMFEIGRLASR